MDKDKIIEYCQKTLLEKELNVNYYMCGLNHANWKYVCMQIAIFIKDKLLILDLILNHKININAKYIINDSELYIFNYAINCIFIDDKKTIEIIQLLLDHGIDVNTVYKNKTILMQIMAKIDNYELITELLDILYQYRLNINATDQNGVTAFMFLCNDFIYSDLLIL